MWTIKVMLVWHITPDEDEDEEMEEKDPRTIKDGLLH